MSLTDYSPKQLMVLGGMLILSFMISAGFLFGPAASYAGLTNSQGGGQNQNEFNASLPDQNYVEGSFSLTSQEQRVLAAQNDVVFLNVFYTTEEELEQARQIEGLEQNFNGRLYIQTTNYSDSAMFTSYGFTEFPRAVAVGGTRQGVQLVDTVSKDRAASTACNVMREWGSLAAYCQGR